MVQVRVNIHPNNDSEVPQQAPPLQVEACYVQAVPRNDESPPSERRNTVRASLTRYRALLNLDAVVASTAIEVKIRTDRGINKLEATVQAPAADDTIDFELTASHVALLAALDQPPPSPPPIAVRRARLIAIGSDLLDFRSVDLEVAPIVTAADWQQSGFDVLFGPRVMTASVELKTMWDGYSSHSWSRVNVGVGGEFEFKVPAGSYDAWAWWLSGARSAVGVVLDDLAKNESKRVVVALPPFAAISDKAGPRRRSTPVPATDAELAENPETYTEDPGEFCKPFQNPERVLGERRFSVLLRAEQPQISPEPTLHGDFPLLDLEVMPTAPRASLLRRALTRLNPLDAPASNLLGLAQGLAAIANSVVTHALPKPYADIVNGFDRARGQLDGSHPIRWEGDAFRYQASTVARGHILEYAMRWRSNGYSLGTVASTLTLAPRQTKRVQKVEWQRRERAQRRERTQLVDEVEDEVTRERDYEDQVRSNLSEWARGESHSSASAAAGGFGFAAGPVLIGGGGGTSNANAGSSQSGGRRVVASEEQRLRDSTRRYAESLRKLESVVVSEVSQEETITGTSEVIRNFNYSHSITVIYYQILRHLRVVTRFVGVRECLFVPLAISPFTLLRAYRWRESIRRGLRDPRYAAALLHIGDVASGFSQSDVPPGRRSDQVIRHISGSIYMALGVERPGDAEDGAYDESKWRVLKRLTDTPTLSIFTRITESPETQADRQFQSEYAPRIAARWVDALQIFVSGQPIPADLTLASRYRFNGQVRVDFSASLPATQIVTRELLASIRIQAGRDLPPGSVANVSRISVEYTTDSFHRAFSADVGVNDLISIDTGIIEPAGAVLSAPPDAWERRDERAEMIRAAQELVRHLNENVEYYHKVIWWNMDRDRLFMLLDGFHLDSAEGVSVASVVERDPIAVVGNSLVFRVSAGSFLGIDGIDTPEALHNYYATEDIQREPLYLSLPTEGLYAQTIMDDCDAIEEHYGGQDWVLTQADIDPAAISSELFATRRSEPEPTAPTPFPQTIINLQNAPEAPAPAGLAGVLDAVSSASAFRDMAGLAGTQANARAAFETAAGLATNFGAQAAAMKLAETAAKAHATQAADQKLASIKKASDRNLVSPETASLHASRVLEELHTPSTAPPPLQDPQVAEAIRAASGVPGSQIETTTAEGQVRVTLASAEGEELQGSLGVLNQLGIWFSLWNFPTDDFGRWPPAWFVRARDKVAASGIDQPLIPGSQPFWPLQLIEDANGYDTNMDLYVLRIDQFPSMNGAILDHKDLAELVRKNLNDFVNTGYSSFAPADDEEAAIWQSADAKGAIVTVDAAGPDNFDLMCTEHYLADQSAGWIFSTMMTADNGHHALSGNRAFGVREVDGTWQFFTQAIDRWEGINALEAGTVGAGPWVQNRLWNSLMSRVATFVQDHGGSATILPPIRRSVPWANLKPFFSRTMGFAPTF